MTVDIVRHALRCRSRVRDWRQPGIASLESDLRGCLALRRVCVETEVRAAAVYLFVTGRAPLLCPQALSGAVPVHLWSVPVTLLRPALQPPQVSDVTGEQPAA